MDSIVVLLQQKPFDLAVKDVIKSGKHCWKTVDLAFIQFMIEILDREWDFDYEDYEELMQDKVDFKSLTNNIAESRRLADLTVELPIREFIHKFFRESGAANILKTSSISNWIKLLMAFLENEGIAMTRDIKGKSFMLLAYFLEPLTNIIAHEKFQDMSDNALEEYQHLEENVLNALSSIHEGYAYEKYGMLCAKEFTSVVLKHHQLIVTDGGIAANFYTMLQQDNRLLSALALKTLTDLCQKEEIHDQMKEVIMEVDSKTGRKRTSMDDDGEIEPLFWSIIDLLSVKNLNYEVVSLLAILTMFTDECDVLLRDLRFEVFYNIFSKNKKLATETLKLMTGLKIDIWREIILMINQYAEDDTDISSLIAQFEGVYAVKSEELLKIINKCIEEPAIMRRAAEIFSIAFKKHFMQEELVGTIIETLDLIFDGSTRDEISFIIILKTLIEIDAEILVEHFKKCRGTITKLMVSLNNAFVDFSNPYSLNIIVNGFKKLHHIQPQLIIGQVRKIANGYYKHMRECTAVQFAERERVVPKLSALFECMSWSLLKNEELIDLYNLSQKYCNVNYTYFAQFIQLRVNVMKHIWMMIAARGEEIIEREKFTRDIRQMQQQIIGATKNTQLSTSDQCLLLSSLLNLYVLFQPKMSSTCSHPFFIEFHLKLSKDDFTNLVENIKMTVFETENDKSRYHQQFLFLNFVNFYNNYTELPSLTAWHTILIQYNAKTSYKADIEILMNAVIDMKKTVFEKSVAFAVLNYANSALNLDRFRAFYNAFDDFMRKKYPDFTQRCVVFGLICSIILDRFSKEVSTLDSEEMSEENSDDRLMVLDYMEIMVKKSNFGLARKLTTYIKINENLLSYNEKRKLDNFKKFLLDN